MSAERRLSLLAFALGSGHSVTSTPCQNATRDSI